MLLSLESYLLTEYTSKETGENRGGQFRDIWLVSDMLAVYFSTRWEQNVPYASFLELENRICLVDTSVGATSAMKPRF